MRKLLFQYFITISSLFFTPWWQLSASELVLFFQIQVVLIKNQFVLVLPMELIFVYKLVSWGRVIGSFFLQVLNHGQYLVKHWFYDRRSSLKTLVAFSSVKKTLVFQYSHQIIPIFVVGFGLWFGHIFSKIYSVFRDVYYKFWFSCFYFNVYFYRHLCLSIILLKQIRILRFKQSKNKKNTFFTLDELWFFHKLVFGFTYNLFTVRLQDMFIPDLVEISYPLSWNAKDHLVDGVYQSDDFFFWAVHKNFEHYIQQELNVFLKVPKYLNSTTVSSDQSTNYLDALVSFIHEAKKTGVSTNQVLPLENALNELYYLFHDHFRLTLLEELNRDPLVLLRLEKVNCSHWNNQTQHLVDNYLFDKALVTRVCQHWEILQAPETESFWLYINRDSNVPFHEDYHLTTHFSLKQKLEIFMSKNENVWTLWDDYKFYWWYTSGEVLLQYYYLNFPMTHLWSGFPYNLWLSQVPEYALPSTAFQNVMLLPCFLIFGITTAFYMKIAVTPMVDDFMTYPQWYWDFRRKFYSLLALDPMDFLGNVFYYRLVTWILIPPYLDWLYMPSGYRRRRLFLNCDLDFTRYVKKVSRYRTSLNPFDTSLTDYFTTRFEQELSPLIPVVSMEQMKSLNKRRARQPILSSSELPVTMLDFEPNPLYYPRIARLRIDTIFMNGLMYLEQDWLNLYVESYEGYRANTENYDAWLDGTHTNHWVDYYNFLNFPIYHPKIPLKYIMDQTITEWYNHIRYVWRAGNWRRGEVSNIGRSTIPINSSLVARHYQAKQLINKTLGELLTHDTLKTLSPAVWSKPFFAHLLSGGQYYWKEDLLLLKLKQLTQKVPDIISRIPKYLDYSFEDTFTYPYMVKEKETLRILEKVAAMEYYNNQFDQFDDDRRYQSQYGGAMTYVHRDALIDGPENLQAWVARRYLIQEIQPKLWSQEIEFWKRDVIVPPVLTNPIFDAGVYSVFKNANRFLRTDLSADSRTGFADVNLTFFTEAVISGEDYDYLKPLYQPTLLNFNNKVYKGPLVKPYDPVVFLEQDGLLLVRASWTKILFFELYRLTTLWKLVKFLLRRYFHSLFMRAITIRSNNPYKQILKSIYLDDFAMDKVKLYNIYGPRSEYHRISFIVDSSDWERMYTKYLTLRFGNLSFLPQSPTVQKMALTEPSVELWKWRKKDQYQIDIEHQIQTGAVTGDLVAKALDYDLLFLSRPEQSFFDNFHQIETTEALRDWYNLDTAYFKRTTTKQTSHSNTMDYLTSPSFYIVFYDFVRRPVNVVRDVLFFLVSRSTFAAPRPRYAPFLKDQYVNWNLGTPLNRELLETFFAGGLTSTRQLPQLPLSDKHFLADFWEATTRYKHRVRTQAFQEHYGKMMPVQISNQLAFSQAKTAGIAATNEIMQMYHRGLTKQHGIASAYDKFLQDWQTLKGSDGTKPVFTASFWYNLPKGFMDYILTDQDRIRFLKNKNLSFSAEQFARVRTLKAYQQYARQVPNIIGDLATKPEQKGQYWRYYYNHYLRRSRYFYRFWRSDDPTAVFLRTLDKHYGLRVNKPFQMNPVFFNTATLLEGIDNPDEQLNILLGVLKNKGNDVVDATLLFDYIYNDLSRLYNTEPQLATRSIDLELSLPGTIVSPKDFRDYWMGVQRYKNMLADKKRLLNTLGLMYRQDRIEPEVFPVMGSLKSVNFFRLQQRFSFLNKPAFNPWEGFLDNAAITGDELKSLGMFLSGMLPARKFFTSEELPLNTPPNSPVMNPQHTQPLSHWKAYQNRLKTKNQTFLEQFKDEINSLLNQSYISPMLRKFFNVTKIDITSLGKLRTFGFLFDDDHGGLDLQTQQGRDHQARSSQTNASYLPPMFQKRVDHYAALISEHKVHLETNVLPPIVYAETPESFIDINLRKLEFEKERKYVAKRMKAYNDQIFKPLEYLRYPRLKERHRHREYFWYCHHFVNNWGYIKLDPKEIALIGQNVLIPDIKQRAESLIELVPVFGHYPNPVGLKNYMTTYSYQTVEMCLVTFNAAEKKRVSEETVLRNEVDYIKTEYAGKYYKEIREELLEPLLEQLARIEYERQTQLALPLWPNLGNPGIWRYEAVDDTELLFDTQDEIKLLQESKMSWDSSLSKSSDYILNFTRHVDYRNYQLAAFSMFSYSSWANKMRYADFRLEDEDETKFSETKRSGLRANLNLLYLQRKNNEQILRYLTQDENIETDPINSYIHSMQCYRETLGHNFVEHNDVREILPNKANYWGVNFINFWDALTGLHYTVDFDMRGLQTPLEVTAQPSYFTGWGYHTRSLLPRYKDQVFLTGYYNVTQRFSTPENLLTQGTSVITPIDLFGTFNEQSLGLHPYEWFDIYDPVSERLLKIVPNSNFIFKNNLFLKRYTGFYRPTSNAENLFQPQGLVENLEHLTSGFISLESQVGRELAVTQLLFKNFGLFPYQLFEFFTFATVWGQNWLSAMYNGSFVESHYKEWTYTTLTDGLFELTESNTKNGESRLRAQYYKILNTKLYNQNHLPSFLNQQEVFITSNHWHEFFRK